VILAHRIALDPTEKQKEYFRQACGAARFVWNWGLAEWNYRYDLGANTDAREIRRYFNSFKYEAFPWLKYIHRDAHAQPFAALGRAWKAYFSGEVEGQPQFKKKGKCRDSFYVACDKFSSSGKTVRLPVIGQVKLRERLRFIGKIQSATVSREADRWFIAVAVEIPQGEVHPPRGEAIGIDLGLTTFAVLSNGERVAAPKPLGKDLQRLRRLSRAHSRKQPGSHNRQKAALRLARCHRRIGNIRRDFLHKFTTRMSKNHAEIFVEDLNVRGMVQNRHLSRAIHDVGWSELRRQLEYKSHLYRSVVTVRNRFYASSKTCSACGYIMEILPLSVREWTCPACQTTHDRNVNAAVNLKQNTVGYHGNQRLGTGRLWLGSNSK
jgi:putative transposase